MPLQLSQVIADRTLGLEVLAGAAGIDRRGPVAWIHTSELPDPSKWLRGGEILLTTGFGVRRAPRAQRRLIACLDAVGCVGIGLGVGDWLKSVPQGMIEEANRRKLPLFTVPYSTPFAIVTRRVAEKIFEEQFAIAQPSVDPRRHILAQVLLGDDVAANAEALAARLSGARVLVFGFGGGLLAARPAGIAAGEIEAIRRAIGPQLRYEHFSLRLDALTLTGAAIRAGALREATLVVASERPPSEAELIQFEKATISVGLALRYGASPRRLRRGRLSELLEDIAEGALVPQAQSRRLAALGLGAESPVQVAAFRAGVAASADLAAQVEDALAQAGEPPLVGTRGAIVHALLRGRDGTVTAIRDHLVRRGIADAAIGVSRRYPRVAQIAQALAEASTALEHADPGLVVGADALTLAGLLPYLRADQVAGEAMRRVLEPVREHDRNHGSALLATLRAWVRSGFSPGDCARALGVHRHTLGYRLQQIARLTGRDLANGDHVLELGLASLFADGDVPVVPKPRRRRG